MSPTIEPDGEKAPHLVYPNIFLREDLAASLAKLASERDMTLNDLINTLLTQALPSLQGQPSSSPSQQGERQSWDDAALIRRRLPMPEELANALVEAADAQDVDTDQLIINILSQAVQGR